MNLITLLILEILFLLVGFIFGFSLCAVLTINRKEKINENYRNELR